MPPALIDRFRLPCRIDTTLPTCIIDGATYAIDQLAGDDGTHVYMRTNQGDWFFDYVRLNYRTAGMGRIKAAIKREIQLRMSDPEYDLAGEQT